VKSSVIDSRRIKKMRLFPELIARHVLISLNSAKRKPPDVVIRVRGPKLLQAPPAPVDQKQGTAGSTCEDMTQNYNHCMKTSP
jgi:hypothetical protein